MEADNGRLMFAAGIDTSQLEQDAKRAAAKIEEIGKAAEVSGAKMQQSLQKAIPQVSFDINKISGINAIEDAFEQLIWVINENGKAINALQTELGNLDKKSSFGKERANEIKAEVALRKEAISEAKKFTATLNKMQAQENANTGASQSLRTKLRELRNELAAMEMNGQRGTAEYNKLRDEMARLTDQMADTQRQASILAHDQRGFQGVLSGVQGLSGVFSAAAGAMTIFGDKSQEMQEIMMKTQALMSITMGLQQLQAALDKDSAFRLVTLGKLRENFRRHLAASIPAQQAETKATQANTTAQAQNTATKSANAAVTEGNAAAEGMDAGATTAEANAKSASARANVQDTVAKSSNTAATGANATAQAGQTAAATAGEVANKGLAGSFRVLSAAIKSVPVFGWIIAGITGIIVAMKALTKERDAARRTDNDAAEKMKEQASELAQLRQSFDENRISWNKLKTAKEKTDFIKKNKEEFHKYGIEVKGIADAERAFGKDSVHIVKAMDLRAKAAAYAAVAVDRYNKIIVNEMKLSNWSNEIGVWDMVKGSAEAFFTGQFGNADAIKNAYDSFKNGIIKENDQLYKEISHANAKQAELEAEARKELQAGGFKEYVGKDGKTNKSSGDPKGEYLKQLEATAKAIEEYRKKLGAEIDKATIDLMDESTDKQIETIRNNAERERQAMQDELEKLGEQIKKEAYAKWKVANPKGKESQWLESDEGKKSAMDYFSERFNPDNAADEETRKAIQNFLDQINTRNKQIQDSTDKAVAKVLKEQREKVIPQWLEYYKQYGAPDEQRSAIEAEFMKKIADAQDKGEDGKWLAEKLRKDMQTALVDFDFKQFQQSPEYVEAFSNLGDMPAESLDHLLGELEKYKKKAAEVWANEPERLREYTDLIKQVKDAIFESKNEWAQYTDARKEYHAELKAAQEAENDKDKEAHLRKAIQAYGRMQQAEEKVRQKADKLATATVNIGRQAQQLAAVWSDDVADGIGVAVDSLETVKDVAGQVYDAMKILTTKTATQIADTANAVSAGTKASAKSASSSISALEKASAVLAIIGAAIQLATMVANLLSNDKKHEKRIQQLQDQIDKLERSYDRLGRKIEEAYSVDASQMIEQQNTLLRQQQALIRQQIAEEEAKKKTDSEKIRQWKEQLEDITDTIEENVKKAVDAITGTSLTSAIDEIADAWADAWTDGVSAARSANDVVKKLLKQGIVEYLKKVVSPDIERWYNKMATALADGTITAAERGLLDKEMSYITDKANQYYQQVKDYFDEDSENGGGTRTAFEGMTQDTAEELNGRFTALQIAGEAVRQQVTLIRAQMEESRSIALTSMSHLEDISRNTRELYQINNRLGQIERNTSRI